MTGLQGKEHLKMRRDRPSGWGIGYGESSPWKYRGRVEVIGQWGHRFTIGGQVFSRISGTWRTSFYYSTVTSVLQIGIAAEKPILAFIPGSRKNKRARCSGRQAERQASIGLYTRKHVYWETDIAERRQASISSMCSGRQA